MRILFLDLDTLRPDHLGCYGYHRNTSPNIDAIAAEAVRFDSYFCSDAPCLPSRAALMSGRFGIHTGVIGHGGTAADMRIDGPRRGFRDGTAVDFLPSVLRRAGYRTCTISPFADRHSAWWFLAGFNEMYNLVGKCGNESAEEITPTVLDWLRRNGASDNWFLHINYWDPHTVYRAPAEFGNPFENDPLPEWLTSETFEEHRRHVGPHSAREVSMFDAKTFENFPRHLGELKDMKDLKRHIDGYDCGIRYMDGHIGQMVAAMKKLGIWEDTAIIISADHGENQGELGIYAEHGTADQITCRIPMIIRWPGMKKGHVDTDLHLNLDLVATLAELTGVEPSARWDGRSYASALTDGASCGRDSIVLSQGCHVCQRSVRKGPWLYMRTYHDGFHLFPQEMLYNIEKDPHEQHNVADKHPDVCRELAAELLAWHDKMMATMPHPYTTDPLDTVIAEGGPMHARGRLKEYLERLKKTERGWAVEELTRRHPGEFGPQHWNR